MAELSKLHREIISRSTMAVVALALLYGGYRCMRAGNEWSHAFRDQNDYASRRQVRRGSGAGYAYGAGVLLLIGGGVFGLMAVVPAETFARLMGPPDTSRRSWDE
jgi:hypothetical protein